MNYRKVNREEFVKTVKFFDPEFTVEKFKGLQKLFNYKRFDDLQKSVPLGVAFVADNDYSAGVAGTGATFQDISYLLVTPVNGSLVGILLGYISNDSDFESPTNRYF